MAVGWTTAIERGSSWASMKPKIKHPKLDPKKNPELLALARLVGDFIEYWGFKSVHGRMWCYLYLIREPLNSRQLAQLLGVSPALVTQSVQSLLKYRVILEADKGKNGVLRFQANPNVAEAVSVVLKRRELALLEKVQAAQAQLERSARKRPMVDGEVILESQRIEQVGEWIGLAGLFLEAGLESLSQPGNPFDTPASYRAL